MSAILDDDPFIVLGPNGPSPAAQSRPAGPCRAGMVSTRSGPALLSPALPKQNRPGDPPSGGFPASDDWAAGCQPGGRRHAPPNVTKSLARNASCLPVAATLQTLYD